MKMKRQVLSAVLEAGTILVEELTAAEITEDHRQLPRSKRRKFRHDEALACMKRDYLGIPGDLSTPLLGAEFKTMFRLSKTRFQVLMEDVMAADIDFYQRKKNLHADDQASLEAQLLLPIKCLAYGVPSHTFIDYFQMSKEYARECRKQFDVAIKRIYHKEYLRLPTVDDLKSILKLHKAVHKVDGLFGSLDCSHTMWKNCPKAWAGSFTGKPGAPSILLESIVDYHMFFWHVSYGYTGNIGDLNVLQQSPLLERMVDGTFHQLEEEAEAVPFDIGDGEFHKCFILVDGIYPKFSRFVKGIKEPTSNKEKKYTAWQEAARKDVERAFGVLKGTWQFLDRPILLHNLKEISLRTTCCIILHNILVADRVMGDCRARYRPSASIAEEIGDVQQPNDLLEVQGGTAVGNGGGIGVRNVPNNLLQQVTRVDRFKELANEEEHQRLHQALMDRFGG
jgi:Plant transposon protein